MQSSSLQQALFRSWTGPLVAATSVLVVFACAQSNDTADSSVATDDTTEETARVEGAPLAKLLEQAQVLLLDVREPHELEEYGTVEGSLNIPIDQLEARMSEIPRDKPILTA